MNRKMRMIFGDVALTIDEDMIEQCFLDWEKENPGKDVMKADPKEISDRLMAKLTASAKPTRTVLHN